MGFLCKAASSVEVPDLVMTRSETDNAECVLSVIVTLRSVKYRSCIFFSCSHILESTTGITNSMSSILLVSNLAASKNSFA